MHERPQKDTNCVSLPQKFYQSRSAKQPEEAQTDEIAAEFRHQSVGDASDNGDKIKCVPWVLEIILQRNISAFIINANEPPENFFRKPKIENHALIGLC